MKRCPVAFFNYTKVIVLVIYLVALLLSGTYMALTSNLKVH